MGETHTPVRPNLLPRASKTWQTVGEGAWGLQAISCGETEAGEIVKEIFPSFFFFFFLFETTQLTESISDKNPRIQARVCPQRRK